MVGTTDSYCVKAVGRCSEVRCNICPRYPYEPHGATMKAYPLDAVQPEADFDLDGIDWYYEEPCAQTKRAIRESLEEWAKRVTNDDTAPEPEPEPKSDAVVRPHHYARWKIEPIEFILRNDMPFWMGNACKYIMRADAKDGIQDLKKAIRYIEMHIRHLEGEKCLTDFD